MRNAKRLLVCLLLLCFGLFLCSCGKKAGSGQWRQAGYDATAFSDEGFYYTANGYLCFLDTKTGVNVYLCSRIGCTHGAEKGDESVCEAYLSVLGVYSTMGFWDGHLYYIEEQPGYGSALMRRDASGAAEAKITDLCQDYITQDTSVQVIEMILADGYLYYVATIGAVIETEPGIFLDRPVRYAISCVDLQTGKDVELYSDEAYITLIAANSSEVLFETRDYPRMEDPDYQEKMKNYGIGLRCSNRESGRTEVLLETTTGEYGLCSDFRDGKIYLSKYENDQEIRSCYDFAKRTFTTGLEIPAYREQVLNDVYSIRKYPNAAEYVLYNSKTGKEAEAFLPERYTFQARGSQGFTLCGRTISEDAGSVITTNYYVSYASLADGMQEDDLIPFCRTNIG